MTLQSCVLHSALRRVVYEWWLFYRTKQILEFLLFFPLTDINFSETKRTLGDEDELKSGVSGTDCWILTVKISIGGEFKPVWNSVTWLGCKTRQADVGAPAGSKPWWWAQTLVPLRWQLCACASVPLCSGHFEHVRCFDLPIRSAVCAGSHALWAPPNP